MRTSKPSAGNKFYITTGRGGYSRCIQGKPTDAECDVLSNCVGYACGRFNEIIGSMDYPYFNCNAENFIKRAKEYYPNLQITDYPTLGGIMVFEGLGDLAGHVMINEKLLSANSVYTSESAWGGTAFFNATRYNTNGRWGMSGNYKFIGNIVNPAIGDVHWVDPTPTPTKYNVGDTVKINGVYVSSDSTEKLNPLYDTGKITYKNDNYRNPYLLDNGNLGWVNDSCIIGDTPAPTPTVDLLDLVRRTIRGDFGNGQDRVNALGDNYNEVQRQVNLNYANGTTRWDNVRLY